MRAARLTLGLLGLAVAGYGFVGLLTDPGTRPLDHLLFLGGVLVGHDLALLPLATILGVFLARWLPAWARAPVQAGPFTSAVVSFIALPFVIGAGRRPDDPSTLPLTYARGLTLVLVLIWTVVVLAAVHCRAVSRPDSAPR